MSKYAPLGTSISRGCPGGGGWFAGVAAIILPAAGVATGGALGVGAGGAAAFVGGATFAGGGAASTRGGALALGT